MKRILRLGNRYALTKHKSKYLKIRYISLLAVLTSMCLYAVKQVSAQQAEPVATAVADIKPLQIGDTIPEWLWHHPLQMVNPPEGQETITLNDYRGKLIILDFWATWCGSCIAAMPKIDQLRREFIEDAVIFPITYQDSARISTFLKTNERIANAQITYITNDSILHQVFPHRLIPHYVWISRKGRVLSTTNAVEVTSNNIDLVLQTNGTSWNDKIDVNADLPLFLQTDLLGSNALMHYSLLFKGKYEGLGKGVRRIYADSLDMAGLALTNQPLFELYFAVAYNKLKTMGESHISKRMILEFDDMTNFKRDYTDSATFDSVYTYNIWVDSSSVRRCYDYLLEDLNRYTRYVGKTDLRNITCLRLTQVSANKADMGLNKGLKHVSSETFIKKLNRFPRISQLVFNGGVNELMPDIPLPVNPDLQSLKSHLRKYGLFLDETNRLTNVFVISKR